MRSPASSAQAPQTLQYLCSYSAAGSGKTKEETRKRLREAWANADAGLVFDAGNRSRSA